MSDLWKWLNNSENIFTNAPQHRKTSTARSEVSANKPKLFVGILAVIKKKFERGNVNLSCDKLQEKISSMDEFQVCVRIIERIEEEENKIKETLQDWSDNLKLNLILTTGGTGFGRCDVTPEATRRVIEKEAFAMQSAITIASLKVTANAMISRAVCGIRRNTLIVNLPGSPKASMECLSIILPALPMGLSQLAGIGQDIAPNNLIPTAQFSVEPQTERLSSDHTSQQEMSHIFAKNISTIQENTPEDRHIALFRGGGEGSQLHESSTCTFSNISYSQPASIVGSRPSRSLKRNQHNISPVELTKVARRTRVSPYPMIPVDVALEIVLKNSLLLPSTQKHYQDALGFVLAENALAQFSSPQFPVSGCDGYAVKALETPGILSTVALSRLRRGTMKDISNFLYLNKNEAMRVRCGSPLPRNANAVVPIEDTLLMRKENDADGNERELEIQVLPAVNCGKNIIPPGSEIKQNEIILKKGTYLESSDIGLLASAGNTQLQVYRKPVVAVISTGKKFNIDRIQQQNDSFEIPDANRLTLVFALKQNGYDVIDMGIADDPITLQDKILAGCEKADVIISTGGSSVGENDFVKPILNSIGANVHFGQILAKPGKLTAYATFDFNLENKCFFALPGKPTSVVVSFNLFVLPALKKMMGHQNPHPVLVKAKTSFNQRLSQVAEYQIACLRWESNEEIPWVDKSQPSGRLLSMVGGSSLMILPPKANKKNVINRGQLVDVLIIDQL